MATEFDAPGDVASDLIASLAAEGEAVDEGHFTLDLAQARIKLRNKRLVYPWMWALLVVEAAWLLGATRVSVRLDPRTVHMTFDGLRLRPGDLARLYDVRERPGPKGSEAARDRALARLAVAIEGAFASGAVKVAVHGRASASAGSWTCFEAQGDPTVEASDPDATADEDDNHLVASYAPRRFNSAARGALSNQLTTRCRWSPLRIDIDGRPISTSRLAALYEFGPAPANGAPYTVICDASGQPIGYASLRPVPSWGRVHILIRGVLADSPPFPQPRLGFIAIVDVDLRKDIGELKVIQGPAFEDLMVRIRAIHDALPVLEAAPTETALAPLEPSPSATQLALVFAGILALAPFFPLVALAGALALGLHRRFKSKDAG